ncbi:MAG: hypothetical protein IK015_09390 [Treponema sp.]|nr:hypothetical protein [Treponema sp.]
MKNLSLWRNAGLLAMFCAALLAFAACSNSSDSSSAASATNKTIYVASSKPSDYMNKVLSNKGSFSYISGDISARDTAPDVFVVLGSDIANLSDDKVRLSVLTCLQEKTLVFDFPTLDNIVQFKSKLDAFFAQEKNSVLKAQSALSLYSPYDFVEQAEHAVGTKQNGNAGDNHYVQKAYEAIAVRKNEVYIVHDIEEVVTIVFPTNVVEGTEQTIGDGSTATIDSDAEEPASAQNSLGDYERLIKDSSQKFASWLFGTGVSASSETALQSQAASLISCSASQAEIENLMKAQKWHHDFTAEFKTDKRDHYNGRWDGKKESVEVDVYVWAVCDIDNQQDYYVVRTSVTCNNQQLDCQKAWTSVKDRKISPYFLSCNINGEMETADGSLVTNQCEPQNTTGTSSFTKAVGVNFGGNAGFNAKGPNAGLSGGYSFTQSSTTNIPDITVKLNKPDNNKRRAEWKFEAPSANVEESGFTIAPVMPKNIQKNMAVFDTWAVYCVPSNDTSLDKDHVKLKTEVEVWLEMLTAWQHGFAYCKISSKTYSRMTGMTYWNHVQKPCNIRKTYVMGFKPPEGVGATDIRSLNDSLKEKCKEPDKQLWYDSATYYAAATGTDDEKNAALNEVAKAQFALAKDKILKNKSVFRDANFKGKYTFYIQIDDEHRIDSFDVDFDQ